MSDQVEEIPMAQESGKNRPLIETVNVLDGRIAGCTDQLNFGVEKGGMNVTAYAHKLFGENLLHCVAFASLVSFLCLQI